MKIKKQLQYIQDKYLGTYILPNVADMNENERYAEMLRLSEHLKQRMKNEMLCEFDDCFAVEFWTDNDDDLMLNYDNILNNQMALATLTAEQCAQVDFLRETAEFISRLNTHKFYYPTACNLKGLARLIRLARLVKDMECVHHCPLTAQSALIMLRIQTTTYLKSMEYAPALDYVAYSYYSQSPSKMLKAIEIVDLHIKRGYKIGLTDEVIVMHDCMLGFMPDAYADNYVKAAKAVLKMLKSVKSQIIIDEVSENQIINLAIKICGKHGVYLDKNGFDILYFCDEVANCLHNKIKNNRSF